VVQRAGAPDRDLSVELRADPADLALVIPYLDKQRAAHLKRIRELTASKRLATLVDSLLADHALFRVEADLRWTDLTEARLDTLAQELNR